MTHEDHRAGLCRDQTLGDADVVIERDRRILDDADAVSMLLQDLVDALPTGTVHEPTVDEHDRDGRGCRTVSRLGRRVIGRFVRGWLLSAITVFFWALRASSDSFCGGSGDRCVPAIGPRAKSARASASDAPGNREVGRLAHARKAERAKLLPASLSEKNRRTRLGAREQPAAPGSTIDDFIAFIGAPANRDGGRRGVPISNALRGSLAIDLEVELR